MAGAGHPKIHTAPGTPQQGGLLKPLGTQGAPREMRRSLGELTGRDRGALARKDRSANTAGGQCDTLEAW